MSQHHLQSPSVSSKIAALLLSTALLAANPAPLYSQGNEHQTSTPIKHLVVIFQENISFDHYFATYPFAANPDGEPRFVARPNTPTVNGLSGALLSSNPNSVKPFRIDRADQATCDQNHDYQPEEQAFNSGLMNLFVETLGSGPGTDGNLTCRTSDVMGYFDGNTVTALWNYVQHFAMNDNSFGTGFGPSTPGAINLVAGQTHGAVSVRGDNSDSVIAIDPMTSIGTVIGDPQPAGDICDTRNTIKMVGKNIGDLLNAKSITWGFFEGGFKNCTQSHTGADGNPKKDYIPHHEPFQYYASTSNLNHTGHLSGRDWSPGRRR
jgi:phospholipase C